MVVGTKVFTDRATVHHELAIWGYAAREYKTEPVWCVSTKCEFFQKRRLGIVQDGVIALLAYVSHGGYIQWRKPDIGAGWIVEKRREPV